LEEAWSMGHGAWSKERQKERGKERKREPKYPRSCKKNFESELCSDEISNREPLFPPPFK
jgi:hypothetical protein